MVEEEIIDEVIITEVRSPTSVPYILSDENFVYKAGDILNFQVSSVTNDVSFALSIANCFNEVESVLRKNRNKVITVTGLYSKYEKNNSTFPNLGLARANAVKNLMVQHDIPAARIKTLDKVIAKGISSKNHIYGPIIFGFEDNLVNTGFKDNATYKATKNFESDLSSNTVASHQVINKSEDQP